MIREEFDWIVSDVVHLDWVFRTGDMGDGFFVQVAFEARCTKTGEVCVQTGRKWYVSKHSTVSEVVGTCLKAVLTALEHEGREAFRYRGVAVYGPHVSVEALVVAQDTKDVRPRHLEEAPLVRKAEGG